LISHHYQTPVAFDISVTVKKSKKKKTYSMRFHIPLKFCNFAIWNIPNCTAIVRWDPSSIILSFELKGKKSNMHEGQEGWIGW